MSRRNQPEIAGWVYVIKSKNNLYKIGRTANIQKRFNALQTQSPVHLTLAKVIRCRNMKHVETSLHRLFVESLNHGEWYALSDEDVEWLKSLKDYSMDRTTSPISRFLS